MKIGVFEHMESFVNVIVPVYKIKEEYLRPCIESLIHQNHDGYRVILVDDGSPDNCGQICDEYAERNEIITVIHQKNQGVSVARNNGMKAATSSWITFVDADDWVTEDYIATIFETTKNEARDADIVMFSYVREYKGSQSEERLTVNNGYLCQSDLECVKRGAFYKVIQNNKFNPYSVISLMAKIYRRSFLLDNDIWYIPEARKGQDRLFNADALNSTAKIYYLNKTLYHYRCWGESRTNRYDPNITDLTLIELKELQNQMIKHGLEENTKDYINCRICTRLYSCMRLYFFHNDNPAPYREKIVACKEFANRSLFRNALESVKMELLSGQEKIFVQALKKDMYFLVYALVKLKSGMFRKKLN